MNKDWRISNDKVFSLNPTERLVNALCAANKEARLGNCLFTGTEHVLLALVMENGGLGKQVLDKLQITEEVIRKTIREVQPRVIASL